MRRIKLLLLCLVCFCILFSACSKSAEREVQRALDFRTELLAAPSCMFSADVTADFGERIYEFALDCTYLPEEGQAELEVTAPETIAGIKATVDGEEAAVQFDGVSLELGTMAGGHVAPMQLPQLLGDAWTCGYIESISEDEEQWLVTYRTGYDSDELLIYTWFDSQMTPELAEVYYDDVCVLSAKIDNFSVA